jgi:hypothetical protein
MSQPSELSEKSVKSYTACLNKLKTGLSCDEEGFKDHKKVIDWIEGQGYSLNTKKLYYIALVSLLTRKNDTTFDACVEEFRKKMMGYNAEQQNIYENQEMTEKEKAKYSSWAEILELREKLWGLVEDYWSFQDYMILCLYTMIPPLRLDFAEMQVLSSEQDNENQTGNYLVLGKSSKFVLQDYKTSKKYGKLEIAIPKPLQKVLEYWRTTFAPDAEYLLFARTGEPMNDACLGNLVRTLFMKHLGKPTGITMLRHAFVNQERAGDKKLRRQQEIARLMAHSVGMNVLYRRV